MPPPLIVNYKLPSSCSSAAFTSRSTRATFARPYRAIRHYAQVGSTTYVGEPPTAPNPPSGRSTSTSTQVTSPPTQPPPPARPYDALVLAELAKDGASKSPSLAVLVEQYMKRAGHVLDVSLPYESRPSAQRRIHFTTDANGVEVSSADDALAIIAHAAHDRSGRHKVTYSMSFAVAPPGLPEEQIALLTCAHTLEEIRHDPLVRTNSPSPAVPADALRSGSLAISRSSSSPTATPVFRPISSVLSAMHRGDLLLLSAMQSQFASGPASSSGLRSLPVNPYPIHPGTPIRAHFVADKPPTGTDREGWTPWVGGTWRKWINGTVVGYRDYAGREAKPGTYDSLAHLHFDPPPTPGSSGGPIVDEESGSVIGVVLGTQLVNQVEGVKGWGVPAEMIFEMFSLPGLKLSNCA
ncbi:hypothetical protein GSI_06856 [Ganoderma sinense ZZ0214-1]|uniref:Uncharacterized protein n=1 Tax=Ganoderma sinense ZZ0214-1 TaxID=1077348 RepID=A0A2G8SEF9_9APHY|nr:hypothetical protein GSI_06856 [Ganoderma sinense ZZ0214-1]